MEKHLARPPGDPYPRGAAEAILLSLAEAEHGDITGACRPTLALLSVLSPAGVPRRLLHTAAENDLLVAGVAGTPGAIDTVQVDTGLARLADASLVTIGPWATPTPTPLPRGTTSPKHTTVRAGRCKPSPATNGPWPTANTRSAASTRDPGRTEQPHRRPVTSITAATSRIPSRMAQRAGGSAAPRGLAAPATGIRDDEPSPSPGRTRQEKSFRPDIEGLRAVAVGTVLLYHAGLPLIRGGYIGVDVFLVISGFLITRLLVDEAENTGTISLSRFYARRIKRLLPLALIVLTTVAVLSWWLLTPLRRSTVLLDVAAASVYGANWRLAGQAIDYFTAGLSTSPVLHFWSLAVEEQFYLVWPVLLLALTWWSGRTGRNPRLLLTLALVAVTAASLGYSAYLTEQDPQAAYLSTLTRGWELALGGVLALSLGAVSRLPRASAATRARAGAVLGWAGMTAIGWASLRFDDNTLFPGVAALVPTLGAVAVIAAGSVSTEVGPARLLRLPPIRYIGRISYAWYLWHWPLLVFAGAVWGQLSPLEGLAVVAASAVPTVLTHHWVEQPLRRSRALTTPPARAFRLGGACTATTLALGLALYAAVPTVPTMPSHRAVGYTALYDTPGTQQSAQGVRPNPAKAAADRTQLHEDGCFLKPSDARSPKCVYGTPSSDTTVVLFGDSHAMHWFPALNALANKHGWRLVALTKSGCPAADVRVYTERVRGEYAKCDSWRTRSVQRIKQAGPAMVVVGGLTTYRLVQNGHTLGAGARAAAMERGYAAMLGKLSRSTDHLVAIRDNPQPAADAPECVTRNLTNLQKCATPRARALDFPPALSNAAQRVDGASAIDPATALCRDGRCPAVIGNILVYRQGTHLTATYARTLAPWLDEQLPALA